MEENLSPASLAVMIGSCVASIGALLFLFQKHVSGVPLLGYEPRWRVPWGPGIAVVALLFPLMGLVLAVTNSAPDSNLPVIVEEHTEVLVEPVAPSETSDAETFVINGLSTTVVMIAFVLVVSLFLKSTFDTDGHDLGLPRDAEQLFADMGIGIVACVAALLPIYVIQFLLTVLLEPETNHPLITELERSHTPAMILVGLLLAVVAAPLSEEFAFRLLLQGWLEKWEDERMGFTATLRTQSVLAQESNEESKGTVEEAAEIVVAEDAVADADEPPALPRQGLLPGLPHGWLPILTSGTLFGLAHLGHGVSPIPLVLFGIVLGYLYQRTHRLVPSITAHALFNGYSMIILWLNLK